MLNSSHIFVDTPPDKAGQFNESHDTTKLVIINEAVLSALKLTFCLIIYGTIQIPRAAPY